MSQHVEKRRTEERKSHQTEDTSKWHYLKRNTLNATKKFGFIFAKHFYLLCLPPEESCLRAT